MVKKQESLEKGTLEWWQHVRPWSGKEHEVEKWLSWNRIPLPPLPQTRAGGRAELPTQEKEAIFVKLNEPEPTGLNWRMNIVHWCHFFSAGKTFQSDWQFLYHTNNNVLMTMKFQNPCQWWARNPVSSPFLGRGNLIFTLPPWHPGHSLHMTIIHAYFLFSPVGISTFRCQIKQF